MNSFGLIDEDQTQKARKGRQGAVEQVENQRLIAQVDVSQKPDLSHPRKWTKGDDQECGSARQTFFAALMPDCNETKDGDDGDEGLKPDRVIHWCAPYRLRCVYLSVQCHNYELLATITKTADGGGANG